MNTRIRTLLAKFKETESTHRGAECLAGLDEIEKFVELIVKECAQVASDYDGAHYVGDAIEQHFGVM
jgi:hypothetical protein